MTDALVSTSWVAERLDEPETRVIEVFSLTPTCRLPLSLGRERGLGGEGVGRSFLD